MDIHMLKLVYGVKNQTEKKMLQKSKSCYQNIVIFLKP